MEQATTRTIRIGKTTIGLIGLDVALNTAAAGNMTEEHAESFLFDAIRDRNYIPEGAEDRYRQALRRAYRQHLHPDSEKGGPVIIRIYGKSCVSCDNLHDTVREVLSSCGLAADIEKIHDPDEIGRSGILITPTLIINGQVKSSGSWPTRSQIELWINELKPED